MLESASISNFKSIRQTSFELAPLTILTGYNSSGKSNILEALSFFGQAGRLYRGNRSDAYDFRRVFSEGDITYPRNLAEYIAYNKDGSNEVGIEIGYSLTIADCIDITSFFENISQDFGARIAIEEKNDDFIFNKVGYRYSFDFNRTSGQKILLDDVVLAHISSKDGQRVLVPDKGMTTSYDPRYVLYPESFDINSGTQEGYDYFNKLIKPICELIREKAGRTYYISSERGTITPEKKTTGINQQTEITWVGYKTENTLELLSDCVLKNPEAFERIAFWAEKFSLGDLRAGMDKDYVLSSRFRDDESGVQFNTSLSGLGARQILSIITQIFYSERGDTLLIEEPEITLHPKYQVLLHELFAEAIWHGKQIICTTHSPFFVLAVSRIIKGDKTNLDDILIYDVSKTNLGTFVTNLPLNKDGFVEGGVESFTSVEAELYREWMDSISLDEE